MEDQHHEVPVTGPDQHLLELEMPTISYKQPHFSCDPCCSFSKQEHTISDSEQRSKSTVKLCGLMVFYTIVMAVEIIGGLKANSLAVLTDAAHLLTDIAGFSISLFTVWASGWHSTKHQSFGYNRIEVLGALFSVQLIWIISGYLIFEALDRILKKQADVNGGLMFAIAAFGFVINFIMVMWLGHDHHAHGHAHHHHHDHDHGHEHTHDHEKEEEITGLVSSSIDKGVVCVGHDHAHSYGHNHDHDHDHGHEHTHDTCHDHEKEEEITVLVPSYKEKGMAMNINIEGAYLHVMADMIQSIGVMIAGLVIWVKPGWLLVDLGCTLIFSVLALGTTLPMLKSIFCILMESTPSEFDVVRLETEIKSIDGVVDVHDLHVWTITVGKMVMSCHVIIESSANSNEILEKVRFLCENTYGIHHVTVQIEQDQ